MRIALERVAARLQLQLSSTGLADYMKRVFGERPLPWMDDQELIVDEDIDFDGTVSGVARAPTNDPHDLGQADTVALGTRRAPRETDVHDLPEFAAELVSVPFEELESSPSIVLLEPKPAVAVDPEPPEPATVAFAPKPTANRRTVRTLLALFALVAIGISIYVIRREATWREDMQAVVPPVEVSPVPRMPRMSPSVPTKVPAIEPVSPAPAPDPKKAKTKLKPAPPAPPPPAPKPPVQKKWDPNSLFLD
jgi:hypothetical protein